MKKLIKSDTKKQRALNILFLTGTVALVGLILYALAQFGVGIPCIFHKITHLSCPGCGNSRAALSLLRLDFVAAFSYNLLFPLEFFYIGWVYTLSSIKYIKDGRFSYKTPHIAMDISILAVVLVWTVVRNILGI